jgi:Protein of unknown function (DUF4232)
MECHMESTFAPKSRSIALLRNCALIGLIGLAAAACGAQSGNHQAAGGTPSTAPAAGGVCTTSHLDVLLDLKSAGVAAGTSLIPLDLTNVSTSKCRLAGYAYVSFATGKKRAQVGAAATADRSLPSKALELGAGKTAHLWLRMVSATNLPARQCKPTTAAGLLLKLPGQTGTIFISHRFRTCAKAVQGTAILTVEPFQSGRARSGTAQ